MSLTSDQIKKLEFHSDLPVDKILDTYEGSFTATASSFDFSGERTHDTISHSFGEKVFTQMIYSRDGGTTWQDGNTTVPDLSGANPRFQTIEVGCYSTTTQIVVVASNLTTSSDTIDYKLVAFKVD